MIGVEPLGFPCDGRSRDLLAVLVYRSAKSTMSPTFESCVLRHCPGSLRDRKVDGNPQHHAPPNHRMKMPIWPSEPVTSCWLLKAQRCSPRHCCSACGIERSRSTTFPDRTHTNKTEIITALLLACVRLGALCGIVSPVRASQSSRVLGNSPANPQRRPHAHRVLHYAVICCVSRVERTQDHEMLAKVPVAGNPKHREAPNAEIETPKPKSDRLGCPGVTALDDEHPTMSAKR